MAHRFRSLALAAALFGAAAPVPAFATDGVFNLYVSGIRAGELTLATAVDGDSYRTTSRISTTGLVGAVARFGFSGESTGRVTGNGTVKPSRFVAHSRSTQGDRQTDVAFGDSGPTRVTITPPRRSLPELDRQVGTIDPLSASFLLLRDNEEGEICDKRLDLFDGSRRSLIRLDKPVAADGGFTCTGTYARVEGEAHSLSTQREYPFKLVFRPNGDGTLRIERIETRTRFGLAVVERRG
jgi:hypothetical protein